MERDKWELLFCSGTEIIRWCCDIHLIGFNAKEA
jgi:hypothetical protein